MDKSTFGAAIAWLGTMRSPECEGAVELAELLRDAAGQPRARDLLRDAPRMRAERRRQMLLRVFSDCADHPAP